MIGHYVLLGLQKLYQDKKNLFSIMIINFSDETKLFCILPKIGLGLQYYSTQ